MVAPFFICWRRKQYTLSPPSGVGQQAKTERLPMAAAFSIWSSDRSGDPFDTSHVEAVEAGLGRAHGVIVT